jgi:hypothetical protein
VPNQAALTVVAEVRPEAVDGLRDLLATMGDGVANGQVLDLGRLHDVHFARLVLVEESTDLKGERLPASLLYLSDFDVSKDEHLADLVDQGGDAIDRLFGHCVGYPQTPATREQRLAFLRSHTVKEQARYVNTIGRTATQIRREAELRDRIEAHLDGHADELRGLEPDEIRQEVRRLVDTDGSLEWARRPAEGLSLGFRLRELAHAIAMGLLVLLLLPFLLIGLPVYLVLLRRRERRDPAPHLKPTTELVQDLAALEDHVVQNPFTAIGLIKPGSFRRLTALVVLAGINVAARHAFNRGNLAGVKTIHFARWVFLDGGRRVMFASNYDGSLENYMDDFIDKIAWGLNIVFSNGYGYPRARFLILDGARDELAFKDYLRLHQAPTRVWHSAYDRLTTANIANNERIRAGLQGNASPREAERWLQAL